MSSWADVEREAPELAARVRGVFEHRRHKTMATLRRDGGPRISGIEVEFEGAELVLGMMPGSVKGLDLVRDPRLAIHAASDDPPEGDPAAWRGDAKVAGVAVAMGTIPGFEPPAARLRVDLNEVVLTTLDAAGQQLVIESWHPGRGQEMRRRR